MGTVVIGGMLASSEFPSSSSRLVLLVERFGAAKHLQPRILGTEGGGGGEA